MKHRLKSLLQLGGWLMIFLLLADIGMKLAVIKGVDLSQVRQFFAQQMVAVLQMASEIACPAEGDIRLQQMNAYRTEYRPSQEDLEAAANENTKVLIEDMAEENSAALAQETEQAMTIVAEQETEAVVSALAGVPTGETYARKSLINYDYIMSHFYVVDPSTSASTSLLNGEKMLDRNLSLDLSGDEPKILIYHTHSQETYADSKNGKADDTVVGVGSALARELEETYHVAVYHDTSVYDMSDGEIDRNMAYSKAAVAVEKILADNPSIEVVIDLHRDGVADDVHLTTKIDGKQMAQVMFLNGLCRDENGDDNDFIGNENLSDNLAFSFQLQLKAKAYYPDLVRHIYLRAYRYNLHFKPRSLLVEVGAQNNTVAEAKNAMTPLAALLYAVLTEEN